MNILLILPIILANSNTFPEIFNAIRIVETGGHDDPYHAIGDNGKSIGPYQIGKLYFIDAIEQLQKESPKRRWKEILKYKDVREIKVAEYIMLAYWRRYAVSPYSAEQLCRLHNGGPSKNGTNAYWKRCKTILLKD